MNTAESDINNYLHKGQTDYISYDRIYNEVLDKVKKGLENQRSSSSILKKKSKTNHSANHNHSKDEENIHPEDIALFQDDDSDESDSDDFFRMGKFSTFRGGLTRAKSHINDINDYNNTHKSSTDSTLDIVKDRIVLNKHFQKIYGFNDSSFRHGDYERYNHHHDEDDTDNESNNESDDKEHLNKEGNNMTKEETPITENITEEEEEEEASPLKTVAEEMTMAMTMKMTENSEKMDDSDESKDDLEKQFYNELRRASMIIDLQQHYRLRDGIKNKEDLKQEIVEGYNSLHNKNYSSEDLPDFQNIDNIEEGVEAKVISHTINNMDQSKSMNSTLSLLNNINEATKNNGAVEERYNEEEINNNKDNNNNKHNNNQLINDTWKFLFNNQYSLQFLSKSLKSSHNKLRDHEAIDIKSTPITESAFSDEKTEKDNTTTEPETSTSNHSKIELENSLMSNILQHSLKNEEKLMKDREEEETLRKNKENDWLRFVQKELANMNLSSSSSTSTTSHAKKETDKDNKRIDFSKFIPNKIPTAPTFEFSIQQDETNEK
ncbi:hypothetical protein PIROE2DRAFT_10775 [Piromyces sp. E2]|nr:hypothetical protein PIROE2DRAFT_10775 [Piromyces sp. E2]|eukprot:OUM62851.1 hypothetical protein PIROE2DRAFT_10775 [Piromyces sp. E2]